jgi:amidase
VDHRSDGQAGVPVLSRAPELEPGLADAFVDVLADAFVERFVIEPTAGGPLSGTPFAVKDIFDVAGRPTGCGNPTWRATHEVPTTSAAVVSRLLGAGARLLGKTRTDELAYSLDGRNFHEGAPRNPAAPERLTGGSSSGAASAVAAAAVDFAVGTDTAGSVRVPAAWCGLFGMRPTHGRISVYGLTALAPSFDTVGWFARSASLMRTVATVLFGHDATSAFAGSLTRDHGMEAHAEAAGSAAFERQYQHCAVIGVPLGEVSLQLDLQAAAESLRILQAHEAWRTHGRNSGPGSPSALRPRAPSVRPKCARRRRSAPRSARAWTPCCRRGGSCVCRPSRRPPPAAMPPSMSCNRREAGCCRSPRSRPSAAARRLPCRWSRTARRRWVSHCSAGAAAIKRCSRPPKYYVRHEEKSAMSSSTA